MESPCSAFVQGDLLLGRMAMRLLLQLPFLAAKQKDTRPGHGQCNDGNDELEERHSFTSLRILPIT